MSPSTCVLFFCACAVVALIVNRWKKLPKIVFVFFAIAIVVSVCWFTLEGEGVQRKGGGSTSETPIVFLEAARDLSIPSGETRLALPTFIHGDREYNCVRFLMGTDNLNVTEQAFTDKVKFSLLFSDGTLLPASGIVFPKEEGLDFPQKFILKVFFTPPVDISSLDARCVVINELLSSFRVAEVSVGVKSRQNPTLTEGIGQ